MVRAEIASAAYLSEADGNYVLAVRGALSDIYSGLCLILYSLLGLVCAIVPAIFTVFCGPYGNLRQIEMPPYRRTTAVRKTRLIVYRRYFACKCVCALEFRLSGEAALACLYIGFEPFSII